MSGHRNARRPLAGSPTWEATRGIGGVLTGLLTGTLALAAVDVLAPARARAQTLHAGDARRAAPLVPAATVPLEDPVYDALDEILAAVPVSGAVVGQRPYSRREVARIARAADTQLRARPDSAAALRRVAALVAAVRAVYDRDAAGTQNAGTRHADTRHADTRHGAGPVVVRPLDAVRADAVASSEVPRTLPPSNGLGVLHAVSLPPLDGRFGRPVAGGSVWAVETRHALGVGPWLAVVAEPRVSWTAPTGSAAQPQVAGGRWDVEPQRLYARAVVRNVALQAGLDEWTWGQAGARGMFLSANARPLHAISLSSDTAFRLPWIFARLGRVRASVLVADLGADQNFPHARLDAWKVNLTPVARLELGVGIESQTGGRGAPRASAGAQAADLFPFLVWLKKGGDNLASNKIANAEARLRVPGWRGFGAYWEMSVDDFDPRRWRSSLWQDTGHLLGLTLDRLRHDGTLALDAEVHHTSLRLYEHYQFTSGVTYRGQILGDPLGPNAYAVYGTLRWRPRADTRLALELAAEARDASRWGNDAPDPATQIDFVKLGSGVIEHRGRALVRVSRAALGPGLIWTVRAGGDRVVNENFATRSTRVRGVADASLQVRY